MSLAVPVVGHEDRQTRSLVLVIGLSWTDCLWFGLTTTGRQRVTQVLVRSHAVNAANDLLGAM